MKISFSLIAVLAVLTMGLTGQASAAGAPSVARDAATQSGSALVHRIHDGSRWSGRWDRQPNRWQYRDGNRHWRENRRNYRDRHYRPRHHRPPSGYYYRYDPTPRYVRPRAGNRVTNAHVRWCQNRYRSYRAWDNTFQPYNGPRRQCLSPYI